MKASSSETNTDLQRGFEPLRTIFAVLVLVLGFAAAARAETGFGTISATARDGQPFELVALASEVHYQIGGLVAEASIRQRFSNSSKDWIEAQYLLPLPEGAAVHDMTLRVGARTIVGEIREKEQARQQAQYERESARARAPARRSTRETPIEAATKSVLRTAGSTITRELLRGLLGGLRRR